MCYYDFISDSIIVIPFRLTSVTFLDTSPAFFWTFPFFFEKQNVLGSTYSFPVPVMYYELNCVPKIHMLEASTMKVTIFGHRVYEEVIKGKWDRQVKESEKAGLRAQHPEDKDHGIWSHHW